jgi:hypothetical protein
VDFATGKGKIEVSNANAGGGAVVHVITWSTVLPLLADSMILYEAC